MLIKISKVSVVSTAAYKTYKKELRLRLRYMSVQSSWYMKMFL